MLQLQGVNMLEKKTIIVDNLSIRYYQSADFVGSGALVFLHGWGSQAMHFLKTLEKCHNVIALDLPGFGESQMPETAWSIGDYAIFLQHFFEKTHIEQPILAGHSFGGSIAIKYCAMYENNVQKLILIGSAGIWRKTPKKFLYYIIAKASKFFFLLPYLRKIRDKVRQKFYTSIGSEYLTVSDMTETFRKILYENLEAEMQKITVPTVLIWGEKDDATPLADGKRINECISGSELHIIPGAGHYVFLDKEKEFDEIFLKSLS